MGPAISAIDESLWDLRGKIVVGLPVYKLLGSPNDAAECEGITSPTREQLELKRLREAAVS